MANAPARAWRRGVAVLASGLALTAAAAPEFPAHSGRVVDRAGLLPDPVRAELTQLLAAHERKTTNQVVVVTLQSLHDRNIDDYAHRLSRLWGIGHEERDNGVLLVVAPNERRVRFHVGFGLEGALGDVLRQQIIETHVLPHFRRGDYAQGIQEGTHAVVAALEGTYRPEVSHDSRTGRIVPLLFLALVGFIVFSGFLGSFFGAAGHRDSRARPATHSAPSTGGAAGHW